MSDYSVAVIGAGPGGYVAAIRCAQLGLPTVCIEKWRDENDQLSLGGTCLNVGCIPSKALLDSTHLYETLCKEAQDHGIKVSGSVVDLNVMHSRKDQIIKNFSGGIGSLFEKNGVDSLFGSASFVDEHTLEIETLDQGKKTITADHIIIATGSVPVTLEQFPNGESVADNAGALNFDEVPVDLGIVGAGVIGLELGSVWRRLGSNVTILEMSPQFLPAVDREISREALKLYSKQGLDIKLGAQITETDVDDDYVSVSYTDAKGEHEVEFDKLIVAVGRKPNTNKLNLEKINVKVDERGFIATNNLCQTNIKHIYAIGDVTAGPMLAHRASKDGMHAAENINGDQHGSDYANIPWIIYTWPEIAWCGQTEEELKAAGIDYQKGKFPFMANGRAHAMNSAEGKIKILTDSKGLVLGVHIIGPNASELIAAGVSAMEKGQTYHDIINEIHAHPTLSEAIHEAALDIEKRTIHI